ncbi:hypothetical protein EJ110_NYTH00892 [Nymphaea thermarum]|nr:hypothetical protein EJ110_NYTH00892 [Nymphaea thermarum]
MEASRWGAFYAPYVGLRLKPFGPPTACSFGRRFVCVSLDSNRSGLADTSRNRKVKPGSGEGAEEAVDRGLERGPWEGQAKKRPREARVRALQSRPFTAASKLGADTGIASEKDWGINLLNENVNESGTNKDGSTWYRESGEDLGENGYRCRWAIMGGRSQDGSSEWRETWWEKADWTGYKELGVEKSGKNAEGDSWWETWKEVLFQDEWSNLARIERSAQKQAKSGNGDAGWYEKWWEKYDAKGWTEKGAHKYGRLNDQSWWEKWGEQYDGTGSVLKWTDKWAETELGTKWGDKWEDKFFAGIGARQGETWHVSPSGDRWSRTWGEEHFGTGKVHKYGRSTTGESWDIVVEEETYYEAEPHYGWADAVGNSTQLLSIQPQERPPGVYPLIDFGSSTAATEPPKQPPGSLPASDED